MDAAFNFLNIFHFFFTMVSVNLLHFFICKNVVFPAQAEYS